jgi:hypothetical protein
MGAVKKTTNNKILHSLLIILLQDPRLDPVGKGKFFY